MSKSHVFMGQLAGIKLYNETAGIQRKEQNLNFKTIKRWMTKMVAM